MVTLVLTMFMAAIESSIISLALPTIRKDLNAGTAVPLVFTVYFIALVVANLLWVNFSQDLRFYI